MPVDPVRAKSLFLAASDLPAGDRAAFLHRECGGDADLRDRVEALLRADEGVPVPVDATGAFDPARGTVDLPSDTSPTGTFGSDAHRSSHLATGDYAPDAATGTFGGHKSPRESSPATTLGTVIAGRYTLVEVIGEGGMGSVYLASQTEPVKRQVALKLIKTGMDSKGVLARFDAERQALALMDHPNIARIYDGGVTPVGQPFFVMELVKGVPLTEYCDQKRLTVDARLQLFVSVCQAVQHAHQKGIIHRDLKPGNVLVTEVDGRPTPKVIDFGVAKATELKLTDMSFADTGAIVGTPAYMSPEQADPSSMDIDTRTDVYALGVILYELLTGTPPIDSKQFKRGAILEMLRMVREVEPPRPSTKLSTAEALPNIAANRNIEPAKLAKLLQAELDWVVMKALEKDRTRRYDTANGLAQDLQRYLADEVVEARPPSRGYRLKKFVKRNRGQVLAASLVLVALVVGIVGTSLGLLRAEQARDAEAKRVSERDAALGKADEALGREAERVKERDAANHDLKKANDEMLSGVARSLLRPLAVQVQPGKPLPPLNEQEIEPLWELASTRDERLRLRFVELALRDADSTRRLKDRSTYALHAAVGLNPTRRTQVEVLLAEQLRAIESRPDEQAAVAICLVQLGALDRPLAVRAASALIHAMGKTTDQVNLQYLAQHLSMVTLRLESKDAAEVAAALTQVISKTTDPVAFQTRESLAQGLSTVSTRLEPKEVAEISSTITRAMSKTTDPSVLSALAQGLSAVATRMEPKDAATTLTQAMSKSTEPSVLSVLARGLSAVAARLEPKEAAEMCGQVAATLTQAMSKTKNRDALSVLALGLSTVADRLEPKQAAEAATVVTEAMTKTTEEPNAGAVQPLARCLSAVAARMEPKAAAAALTRAMSTTSERFALQSLAEGLSTVASRMESKDAADVSANLAKTMIRTTDQIALRSLAVGLSAVAARLEPKDAAQVCRPVAVSLTQTLCTATNFASSYGLPDILRTLAARLEPKDAANAAADFTQALNKTTNPDKSIVMARGISAVAARLEPKDAANAIAALTQAMNTTPDLVFLADGLSALTTRLEPKDAANVAATLLTAMTSPALGQVRNTNSGALGYLAMRLSGVPHEKQTVS